LRIGQFTDTFYPIVDGVGRVVFNYATHLPRLGHECYVIAPMANTGYRGGFPFELVDFNGASLPGSRQYKAGIAILDRHYHARIADIPLDIIHAHAPFSAGMEALRLTARRDLPLIGSFHSKYYDDFYKATGYEVLAHLGVRFVVDFYERCDEVWAVSKSSAEVLRGYGYSGDIVVMENGTEQLPIVPENAMQAAAHFHIPEGRPVLLYVGQMDWKKNILHILEAAALLRAQGLPFTLVLAGQGVDMEAIRAKAETLSIGADTIFTGHISDAALLSGLYQRADLFVFPSLYDTFSLVLREAASLGTPAVVTRGSSPAEAIEDAKNGFLAEDTPEDLARAMKQALSDPVALSAIGAEARASIPIAWNIIMERVIARYAALIERSKRGELKRRHDILRDAFAERMQEWKKLHESLRGSRKKGLT